MSSATDKTRKIKTVELASSQTTTGAGTSHKLPRNKTIHLEGITTGTVLIEGSNDGTNFFTLSTDTSDAIREISAPHLFTRTNVTVATSVSLTATASYEED